MIKMSSIINNIKVESNFLSFWKGARSDALQNFKNKGFPSKKNEAWKYTSLQGLSEDLLEPSHSSKQIIQAKKPMSSSFFIKVVNGHIDLENSVFPEGLRVLDLEGECKDESSELVMKSLFENSNNNDAGHHDNERLFNSSEKNTKTCFSKKGHRKSKYSWYSYTTSYMSIF